MVFAFINLIVVKIERNSYEIIKNTINKFYQYIF